MPDSSAERTEKATPKKRQDERKKGNIFMSRDINTLVSLIISFYAFRMFIAAVFRQLQAMYDKQIERVLTFTTLPAEEIGRVFLDAGILAATTILPAMLIAGLASILINLFQTRGLVSMESMKFKFSRLSLISGFKKFFSLRSVVELVKSMAKIVILVYILYGKIRDAVVYLPNMIDWEILQALAFIGEQIMSIVLTVAVYFAVIAAADYLYQWWEYEKGLKMTKQEIKDEFKQMEGDPQIKSKRRQKQMEMAQRRMMQAVKDADVIVRNPTHYAVALKYTIDKDPAPIVLAKGADRIAQRIVEEGEKHHIATVENKALARGLYDASDVFGYIPAEFFQPVAELLAWLYSMQANEENTYRAGKPS